MKYLIFLVILITVEGQASCLSGPLSFTSGSNKDLAEFERTIESFQEDYKTSLPPSIEMVIRVDVLNNRINADITKVNNQVVVQIFGGMLNHNEMNSDVLQLLLCHELGHFLGGPPLKSRTGWSSTEGQADYFSGRKCAHALKLDEQSFIDAALKLTAIYAEVRREGVPAVNLCETLEVSRTNYGYPSSQCRLDTMIAGFRELDRPRCWFFE
jgi:hypothetical protein